MSQWREGTADVTSGSAAVVGTDTSWLSAGFVGGELFTVLGSGVPYFVAAPPSDDTHLTLSSNYGGITASGQNYAITTGFEPNTGAPYMEFGDVDTPTIFKRAVVSLSAFSALGVVDVAGGAGTVVLTAEQARVGALEFTGAITGNQIIEVPASPWIWPTVYNNTTGAYTLTVETNAGTGVTVRQGTSMALRCDGTDVVPSADSSAGNWTVTGDATISGKVIIGQAASIAVDGVAASLQISNTSGFFLAGARWSANANASTMALAKSRGAAVGTHGAVVASDLLGLINFYGSDGTDFVLGASITVSALETFATTSNAPSRLALGVITDGSSAMRDGVVVSGAVASTVRVGISNNTFTETVQPATGLHFAATSSSSSRSTVRLQEAVSSTTAIQLEFYKNRGASLSTPTVITTGDDLGIISAWGYTGSTGGFVEGVRVTMDSAGAITDATNGLGGIWKVSTRANAGNLIDRVRIDNLGNVNLNSSAAALATNATDGFTYLPTCAGTPTGTPTTFTGAAPAVVNTTNNKLYFYSGGAWRDAGP